MSERITIEIETGGAAFDDGAGAEAARILRKLAQRLESGDVLAGAGRLFDLNGNACGRVTVAKVRRPRRY